MDEQVLRARKRFLGILSLTVMGMTAGIAWVAATNPGVTWQPPSFAVVVGAVTGVRLLRVPARRDSGDGGSPSRLVQALAIGVAAGAVPFLSALPVTWEVAVLTFIDSFLAVVLIGVFRRLHRDPHG